MKKYLFLLILPFLLSTSAFAQIVTVGTPTTQWSVAQKQAAGYFYWPDTDIGVQQIGGTYYLDAASGSGGIDGFTTSNLATFPSGYGQQGNNWPGTGGAGSFDQNYSGGGPIYYDAADGLLIMFYHGEYWYGGTGNPNPFISGIGMAVSSNNGASWTKLGEIIAPNVTWANLTACGTNQSEDMGSGAYIVNGSNLYIYFTDYSNTQCQDQYLAVAAAPIANVIAAAKALTQPSGTLFKKYSGGTFSTPGVNNPAAPSNGGGTSDNLNPPGVNPGGMAHPNVGYISSVGEYVMVWFDATGIGISESANGISWGTPQAIFSDGTPPGGGNSYVYPTLLNTSGGSPTALGTTFTMWYLGDFSGDNNGNLDSVSLTLSGTPSVATPTFSPTAGSYSSTQSVSITTTTPSATICYTIDGSTPTASAGSCTHGTSGTSGTSAASVSVAVSETVKAIGTKSGSTTSSVGSAAYTITSCSVPSGGPTVIAPINLCGAAAGCDNISIQCTYTDPGVAPGQHFYFVVAENANGYATVSNSVNVTVPSGMHNAVITWNPSTTTSPTVQYYLWRGAPPTNLKVISVQ